MRDDEVGLTRVNPSSRTELGNWLHALDRRVEGGV